MKQARRFAWGVFLGIFVIVGAAQAIVPLILRSRQLIREQLLFAPGQHGRKDQKTCNAQHGFHGDLSSLNPSVTL